MSVHLSQASKNEKTLNDNSGALSEKQREIGDGLHLRTD